MEKGRPVALSTLVLALVALAVVLMQSTSRDDIIPDPPTVDLGTTERHTHSLPALTSTPEAESSAIDVDASDVEPAAAAVQESTARAPLPADVPHVARDGRPARLYVDDSVFEDRWAGASLDELELARLRLTDDVGRSTQTALNEYFDLGGGTQSVVARESVDIDARPPPTPLQEKGLIKGSRSEVMPDGRLLMTKGALPWHEFTELYNQQDEVMWLLGEIHRRKKALASSDG